MKYDNSVFVSGSAGFGNPGFAIRNVSHLPKEVKAELDAHIAAGRLFLVGDCPGVDAAVQEYLACKNYANILVYHSGPNIRVKIRDDWPSRMITPPAGAFGRAYYTAKDKIMCSHCEQALAIWDGNSKGTKRNIDELRRDNKAVKVYRLDTKGWEI